LWPDHGQAARYNNEEIAMKWSLIGLAALAVVSLPAAAQKSTADGIAEYRAMLADGNPAELFEAKGEALWKEARGPKKATLEKCDLGKGPGVVKGAFVELPRYFADTQRVQDLESRLLTCMETLQGFNAAEIARTRFGAGEQKTLESLVAYISAESRDMAFNLPQSHPQEKLMYEVARRCSTCVAARTTSLVRPAMVRTTSVCACRTCPTSPGIPVPATALVPGRPTVCPAVTCGACSAA
jgi:hypothetical protein